MLDIDTPVYAWVRDYSHTDRRHWLIMLTEMASDHQSLKKPDNVDSFLVMIRKLPLDEVIYDEDADRMAELSNDTPLGLKDLPYLGATWSKTTPDKLRISTRRAARAQDVVTYAEMDAEPKDFIPLVLEVIDLD